MSVLDGAFEDRSFEGLSERPGTELRDAIFEGCLFRKCQLAELRLVDCRFIDCRFEGCDLRMVKLPDTVISGVHFESCGLMGINWTGARGISFQASFSNSRLDYGVFSGMRLAKLQALNCSLREVDFSEAELAGASFDGSELQRALFRRARLEGVDFTGARGVFLDDSARCKDTRIELETALGILAARGLRVPALEPKD